MDQCVQCGHPLGVGRFCVGCGHQRDAPVVDDARTTTAERPVPSESPWGPAPSGPPPAPPAAPPVAPAAPPAVAPPTVYETPPQVRYPLYADEPAAEATVLAAQPPVWESASEPPGPAGSTAPAGEPSSHRGGRGYLPWVLVAVALVLVAGMGVFLLVGTGDDTEEATDPQPTSDGASQDPSVPPSSSPAATPSETPTTKTPPGEPRDVGRSASATVPATAAPSRDVNGNAVRYEAANMLDGQADTAWRMPGDGAGSVITFTLEEAATITEVGLVNGYAKREPGYDGYTANRRILSVEWVFADGTVVPQTLRQDSAPQTIGVDTATDTVELRIVEVSRPGRGPSGRDFTAISDVTLVGVPL